MGCHFGSNDQSTPLLLNYLDDTLGRYRVRIVKRGKRIKVAGTSYSTIEVQSEPFESSAWQYPPSRQLLGWLLI